MPPRGRHHAGQPIGCRHSPFARAHPHLHYVLGYLYDHSTTYATAAVLYTTVLRRNIRFGALAAYLGKSEGWVDKASAEAVIGLAVVAWLARPAFLVAELVWGLRALEAEEGENVGAEGGQEEGTE